MPRLNQGGIARREQIAICARFGPAALHFPQRVVAAGLGGFAGAALGFFGAGGFGLPESVDVTFDHLIDALDIEFRRLGRHGR